MERGQADDVLAIVRGVMNFYASRADDYVAADRPGPCDAPIRKTRPRPHARRHRDSHPVEDSSEEPDGAFGAFVRLLLLSAQRRDKIATWRWADLRRGGRGQIPAEERPWGARRRRQAA